SCPRRSRCSTRSKQLRKWQEPSQKRSAACSRRCGNEGTDRSSGQHGRRAARGPGRARRRRPRDAGADARQPRRRARAAELLPGVDEVLTWPAPWISDPAPDLTCESTRDLLEMAMEFGPDAAVIFTSFHQSPLPLAALLRLAGVPHITGASIDYAGSLLTTRLKPGEDFPEDQPEVLRALDIAEAAGFPRPTDTRLAVQ